jgi:hypothetical protein
MRQITKGDFVRIIRYGSNTFREHLWFYLYCEGILNVPFNWHLAVFTLDVGTPIVRILTPIVNHLVRSCVAVRSRLRIV